MVWIRVLLLFSVLSGVAAAQAPPAPLPSATPVELKARAVSLLGDIQRIIAELRVPQSRIKAQFQAANLLWDSDEKRALKYITDAIAGFRELRMAIEGNPAEYFRIYEELSQLRYELASLLMRRQPEMALNFIRSIPPFRDPYNNSSYFNREQMNQQTALEIEIANQIVSTDPKRALEIAREALKSGYSQNLMNMIGNINQKKPELATELVGDIVNKMLNEKQLLQNLEAVVIALRFLRVEGPFPRGPMFPRPIMESNPQMRTASLLSEQERRDLLQKLANEAMNYRPPSAGYSPEREMTGFVVRSLQSMGPELAAVVTGGAVAFEKRANELRGRGDIQRDAITTYQNEIKNLPADEAIAAIGRMPKEFRDDLYLQLATRVADAGDTAKAKQIVNANVSNVYQRWSALIQIEEQEAHRAMSKGKIEEALRNIANIPNAEERASMVNQIIDQIGPGLKPGTALNYLEQARALFSPSARAQGEVQLGALCGIATAFSRYDAKRAFEILDPLVDQLNDLTDAARVLEGFGGHFYEQDEFRLNSGAFNAISITNAIGTLALTDFDRARLMSDRIKLPEVRLRAYLDIAQQALRASR